ncbi:hypothetical protein RclHR1_04420008 [Rhizophagus clarus]|uniref:Uncharacterized protein n=1 Tax=Rhizophagus clarus TaxID=94130 RepID=A0A2Z6RH14_9GLOM|nr:hypothetical protein RclHR1_04420008 [Rhizophagus clarus]
MAYCVSFLVEEGSTSAVYEIVYHGPQSVYRSGGTIQFCIMSDVQIEFMDTDTCNVPELRNDLVENAGLT